MFDALSAQYGNIEYWPRLSLRTFKLALFQHKTFCRFSDVANVKLNDLIFHNFILKGQKLIRLVMEIMYICLRVMQDFSMFSI
jgi:hypothetical protein